MQYPARRGRGLAGAASSGGPSFLLLPSTGMRRVMIGELPHHSKQRGSLSLASSICTCARKAGLQPDCELVQKGAAWIPWHTTHTHGHAGRPQNFCHACASVSAGLQIAWEGSRHGERALPQSLLHFTLCAAATGHHDVLT